MIRFLLRFLLGAREAVGFGTAPAGAGTGGEPDLRARYRAAVDAMPVQTRTVFLLHRTGGLDVAEIAERTRLTTRSVEQHIADAILHLSAALDDNS